MLGGGTMARDAAGEDASASPDPVDPTPAVPAAEKPLDPRAIARASLQASRNASLWWTAGGVVLAVVVALLVGTAAGAWTLSAVLAAGAIARALGPRVGPVAITVRSKPVDVAVLLVLSVGIAVLAAILPSGPV